MREPVEFPTLPNRHSAATSAAERDEEVATVENMSYASGSNLVGAFGSVCAKTAPITSTGFGADVRPDTAPGLSPAWSHPV